MSRTLEVDDGAGLVTIACGPVGRRIKLEVHHHHRDARPSFAAVDLTPAEALELARELTERANDERTLPACKCHCHCHKGPPPASRCGCCEVAWRGPPPWMRSR